MKSFEELMDEIIMISRINGKNDSDTSRSQIDILGEHILSLYATLQERVKQLEGENKEFEKQFRKIMDEPCEDEAHCTCVPFLKIKITDLEAQVSNLKCCGNCKKSENGGLGFVCTLNFNTEEPNHVCPNWQSDNLSQEERCK